VRLAEIDKLRTLGSAVQVITRSGDKHLLKYLADRPRVVAEIEATMARAGNAP
jgi:roadblock/LC7 domain-containing protein